MEKIHWGETIDMKSGKEKRVSGYIGVAPKAKNYDNKVIYVRIGKFHNAKIRKIKRTDIFREQDKYGWSWNVKNSSVDWTRYPALMNEVVSSFNALDKQSNVKPFSKNIVARQRRKMRSVS